jgi:Family of unknown function (DUF6289)
MNGQAARPVVFRWLALTALAVLAVWALLLPTRPAFAYALPPQCSVGYSRTILYYNNAQHQEQVGESIGSCEGGESQSGESTAWWTVYCEVC